LNDQQNIKNLFRQLFLYLFQGISKGLNCISHEYRSTRRRHPTKTRTLRQSWAFDFFRKYFSRWRMEGVVYTSKPSILHPEKIPRKKSKAHDGTNVCNYYLRSHPHPQFG
jgi:hypothetical protein